MVRFLCFSHFLYSLTQPLTRSLGAFSLCLFFAYLKFRNLLKCFVNLHIKQSTAYHSNRLIIEPYKSC